MADMSAANSSSFGVAFLVSAGIVYEIIAFACSSPQTAEINIRKRADTLMKWVRLGEGLGAALVVIAATIDRKHRAAILAGGAFAIVSSEAFYRHAKASGLRNGGLETEEY